MYKSTTAVSKREKELARKRAYNAVYFADPANQERKRQLALKPEQKLKRKLYKKTERGKAAEKRYEDRHQERRRTRSQTHRYKRYGLTPEEVTTMRNVQNDACGICDTPFVNGRFHIDHDHTTGKVRGLLCTACNMALGLLKDSPAALRSALNYLGDV